MNKRVSTRVAGFNIHVFPTVFHPSLYFSSKFLAKHITKLDLHGLRFLDMGSGTGIISIIAAAQGAQVTAVDVSAAALSCCRHNVKIHGFESIVDVHQSDLFESVATGDAFDYIVWNPPFYEGIPVDESAFAWRAGKDYETISRFAANVGDFLSDDGRGLIVLSSDMPVERILSFFTNAGFVPTVVQSSRFFFERLFLVSINKNLVLRNSG